MNLKEAFEKQIRRIYLECWATGAYLELPLLPNGMHGPWVNLVSPVEQKIIGDVDVPQKLLWFQCNYTDKYLEYKGPIREGDSEWNEEIHGIEEIPKSIPVAT